MTQRLTTDSDLAIRIAEQYGTPFYLVSQQRLLGNIHHLQRALRSHYPATDVTYSVKSNNLGAFVSACIEDGIRVEVVSRAEYDYVAILGADLRTTIYNGPAKTADDMQYAIDNGSYVNVDSIDELRSIANLGIDAAIGIRVPAVLASGAISRFGIDLTDDATLAETRELVAQLNVTGLHIHHSSHRHPASYGDRLEQLLATAEMLDIADLKIVDLGGGFSSPIPPEIASKLPYTAASFDEYGDVLGARAVELLGTDGPRLVLEPGIGVLANCATYVTRVASLKHNGGHNYAVVDGSIFEVNPLRSTVGPPLVCLGDSDSGAPAQVVGATCMEIDIIGDLPHTPSIGDLVSVENVGSYSTSLAPDFIIPRSPVISADTGELLRLRSSIQSVGLGPVRET